MRGLGDQLLLNMVFTVKEDMITLHLFIARLYPIV